MSDKNYRTEDFKSWFEDCYESREGFIYSDSDIEIAFHAGCVAEYAQYFKVYDDNCANIQEIQRLRRRVLDLQAMNKHLKNLINGKQDNLNIGKNTGET